MGHVLGFDDIRGTSDVGLVARGSLVAGLGSTGTRWIWHVKPPTTGAADKPGTEGQHSDGYLDSDDKAMADAFPQVGQMQSQAYPAACFLADVEFCQWPVQGRLFWPVHLMEAPLVLRRTPT